MNILCWGKVERAIVVCCRGTSHVGNPAQIGDDGRAQQPATGLYRVLDSALQTAFGGAGASASRKGRALAPDPDLDSDPRCLPQGSHRFVVSRVLAVEAGARSQQPGGPRLEKLQHPANIPVSALLEH